MNGTQKNNQGTCTPENVSKGTYENSACTLENHAKSPENCTVSEKQGTLGHMRIVRGGGVDVKSFLSSLFSTGTARYSQKTPEAFNVTHNDSGTSGLEASQQEGPDSVRKTMPAPTPTPAHVPLCTLGPVIGEQNPPKSVVFSDSLENNNVPLDVPLSNSACASPVQFLCPQAVAHAAIEQAEPSPAIQQRLKDQYAKTLQAYAWITDLSERHQSSMDYLDVWLEDGYGQRLALDGISDGAGAFQITSWRLVPCDKPQTATPNAPVHAKATTKTSTLLPGMGRAAI